MKLNNFNELKLLDIKVNHKELYNKNRMIRIVEESEFYFEYDENNIEFKNNQRDFYKIKCKIDDDIKKIKEEKKEENKKSEKIIIQENELKSLQVRALLKSKRVNNKNYQTLEDIENYEKYNVLIKKIFEEKILLNKAFQKELN